MSSLKVSIVTVVYNRVSTLEHALRSVQAQSYSNTEHLVQDGGSTDGTLDVIAACTPPEILLESAPDTGIYDALNKGLMRASGEILGLMHSDDFFASDTVLAQVAEAFEDPAIDGVYGDLDYVAAGNTSRVIRRWRSGEYTAEKLRRGWMPPHPTLYLRRAVFEQWGYYDTEYRIASDYDAILRYLSKGQIKLAYIPEVFVKMRMGGESNRSLSKIIQKSREDLRALRSNHVGGIGTLAAKNFSKLGQFL